MPSHYLNQCFVIFDWNLRNTFQWNFNQNTKCFIHENAYESILCKMAAILSRGRWVKRCWPCWCWIYLIKHTHIFAIYLFSLSIIYQHGYLVEICIPASSIVCNSWMLICIYMYIYPHIFETEWKFSLPTFSLFHCAASELRSWWVIKVFVGSILNCWCTEFLWRKVCIYFSPSTNKAEIEQHSPDEREQAACQCFLVNVI